MDKEENVTKMKKNTDDLRSGRGDILRLENGLLGFPTNS